MNSLPLINRYLLGLSIDCCNAQANFILAAIILKAAHWRWGLFQIRAEVHSRMGELSITRNTLTVSVNGAPY